MSRDRKEPFRFKQFAVSHHRSSMRVGVDGVLIGSWSGREASGVGRILDAGCGCGLIALMAAQRFGDARIDAIDIDVASVDEASNNFSRSPWSPRLSAFNADFNDWLAGHKEEYDLVISNPPFFDAGVAAPDTPREKARHQGSLSPARLVMTARELLKTGGLLALIAPKETLDEILECSKIAKMRVRRITYVKGNPRSEIKRVMVELEKVKIKNKPKDAAISMEEDVLNRVLEEVLVIEKERGEYTQEYKSLTDDFYIIF